MCPQNGRKADGPEGVHVRQVWPGIVLQVCVPTGCVEFVPTGCVEFVPTGGVEFVHTGCAEFVPTVLPV